MRMANHEYLFIHSLRYGVGMTAKCQSGCQENHHVFIQKAKTECHSDKDQIYRFFGVDIPQKGIQNKRPEQNIKANRLEHGKGTHEKK